MSSEDRIRAAVNARIKQGLTTKEKLLSIIAASEPVGKSSAELREEMNLSRDRIHTICKEYIDEAMLYKTARSGKYRLTQKALGDPARKGYLFCLKAMKDFFSLNDISLTNMFCNTSYNRNIVNSKEKAGTELLLNRDPNILDKLGLFEFALKIGAFITYEMIMAIKFASDSSEDGAAKDMHAWRWIDSALNSHLMLAKFKDISPVGNRLKRNRFNDIPQGPFYDMNARELETLFQSFQDVFPEVYRKSENILSGLQSRINSDRKYMKVESDRYRRMEIEDPNHTTCGGQLIPKIITTSDGRRVQKCSKCHRWIKV